MTDNLDALRHIEGFPIGEDEDILALSDPPHYTAYPNSHIAEFIAQHGKPYDEATDTYHCEPFVSDVSEGKTDPIYQAHTYHTKVPYKAIVPFIRHYTSLGDVVFDGFCGSGMTGIAAQSIGRYPILNDLSPAATFIAYNFNTPVDASAFLREAKRILKEASDELGWMYTTSHADGRDGRINFTVWSEVSSCPYCGAEVVFWEEAFEADEGTVKERFRCPDCGASLTKRDLLRVTEHVYDSALREDIERLRYVPVLINYTVGGKKFEKRPGKQDLEIVRRIEESEIPFWYPTYPVMFKGAEWGDSWRAGYHSGITRIHQFYLRRSLWTTSFLWDRVRRVQDVRLRHHLMFWLQSVTVGFSRLNRYLQTAFSQVNRMLSGTLYVGSTVSEVSPWYALQGKIARMAMAADQAKNSCAVFTTSSTAYLGIPSDSVDYIFTDPPFGDNLMYSELNFIWESWLRVHTNNATEAIINKSQGKSLNEYRELMTRCFSEMYRVLKPGRWITVVFHNSRASVWNSIQEALAKAGFMTAQVTIMDKGVGSFKQVTSAGAVKNDLVINAYKPRHGLEISLTRTAGLGQESSFVWHHLDMLPPAANIERSREMLYSKLLAYYVQRGYEIRYNADQFYRLLDREFVGADGYYFRDEAQRGEYEVRKLKLKQKELAQAPIFVLDERSALQWLWHFLDRPRTYSDIYTAYVKALQAREDEIPELRTLLDENFVRSNGDYRRPDVATKQELEQKRQARLLREFDDYLLQARAGRKLKDVRKEAVIAGFTQAYREQRFADILTVGRKLDKKLVEASTEIFDFMDIAEAKVER